MTFLFAEPIIICSAHMHIPLYTSVYVCMCAYIHRQSIMCSVGCLYCDFISHRNNEDFAAHSTSIARRVSTVINFLFFRTFANALSSALQDLQR